MSITWTSEQNELCARHEAEKMPCEQSARILGKTLPAVWRKRQRLRRQREPGRYYVPGRRPHPAINMDEYRLDCNEMIKQDQAFQVALFDHSDAKPGRYRDKRLIGPPTSPEALWTVYPWLNPTWVK